MELTGVQWRDSERDKRLEATPEADIKGIPVFMVLQIYARKILSRSKDKHWEEQKYEFYQSIK